MLYSVMVYPDRIRYRENIQHEVKIGLSTYKRDFLLLSGSKQIVEPRRPLKFRVRSNQSVAE